MTDEAYRAHMRAYKRNWMRRYRERKRKRQAAAMAGWPLDRSKIKANMSKSAKIREAKNPSPRDSNGRFKKEESR